MRSAKANRRRQERLQRKIQSSTYKQREKKVRSEFRNISKSGEVRIHNNEWFPEVERFLQKCQKKGYSVYEARCAALSGSLRYIISLSEKSYSGFEQFPAKLD